MHTDGLKNEERQSMKISLEDRYKSAPSLSNSGNAKNAGAPAFAATDAISNGDNEFRPQQGPAGIRNDTRSVQKFTWEQHGGKDYLPTIKYAPSGRL